MVLVSHRYKFIFIKTKKTGSTTTENFLTRFCLGEQDEENYKDTHAHDETHSEYGIIGKRISGARLFDLDKAYTVNTKLKDVKNRLGEEKFNTYAKIANIRNPYDTMVSLFFFIKNIEPELKFIIGKSYTVLKELEKKHPKNTDVQLFRKFIKRSKPFLKFNKNSMKINGIYNCDYYIRNETLNEDLIRICKDLNIDTDKYQIKDFKTHYRNKSQRNYRKYYNKQSRLIVQKLFSDYNKKFNYTF
jgi:hypothetical protein